MVKKKEKEVEVSHNTTKPNHQKIDMHKLNMNKPQIGSLSGSIMHTKGENAEEGGEGEKR